MRLIGTLGNQDEALRFSSHLKQKGIATTCEVTFDPKSGHMSYQLWVHDEDRITDAIAIFEDFRRHPSRTDYDVPVMDDPPAKKEEPSRSRTPFTIFVIALCSLIFFFSIIETISLKQEGHPEGNFLLSPLPSSFLFDFPPSFENSEEKGEIEALPFWRGAYTWILLKAKGEDTTVAQGPLFYKIRQGELWRLFTPCLLHGSFLHILFNMIWVWVLGRPIELRIGFFRTLLLTLATGIAPNVAQYLMSGPLFLGYSGIVMGLAGFTWMRERAAPWEGYPLNRSTILFLLFFIGAMFALQFASFLMQLFTNIPFEPNIANTAHIVGALVGAGLGRLSYFSWRAK